MRIKKVLSLAVVLAMVLTVVPMFGLTASAADETYEVEFTLHMDKCYKDIKITDTNGKIITGFCIAVSNDGFFPFVREEESAHNDGKSLAGTQGDIKEFEGASIPNYSHGKKVGIWYTDKETRITIKVTNDTSSNSYTVTYSTDQAIKPSSSDPLTGYTVSRTYTDGTAGPIATPEKWIAYGDPGAGNDALTSKTICNYLTDMKITNAGVVSESKTLTVTYGDSMADKNFTYKAPIGTTVDIPAYAVLDGTGANAVVKSWKHTASTEEIQGDKNINIKMVKVDAMAQYAFSTESKAKAVKDTYGDGTLKNEGNLSFSDNGFVTYKGNNGSHAGKDVGYVDLPANIAQDLTGSFTVSMWVNLNERNSAVFWDMCKDDTDTSSSGAGQTNRVYLKINNGKLNVNNRMINSSGTTATDEFNDATGKWALVTTSIDLTNKIATLYVNGTPVESDGKGNNGWWNEAAAPSKVYDANAGAQAFHLGRSRWACVSGQEGGNPSVNGSIADVRIYDSALTAEEVAALMGVHRVSTIKYMAGDQEIDTASVDTFTDTVTFEAPKTITYNSVVYELQSSDDITEGSNKKGYAETFTVNYAKKNLELKEPEKVYDLGSETIIEGNVPAAKYIELETKDSEITKINGVIDWDFVNAQLRYTDGQPHEIIVKVKADNDANANITAKINLTVLSCSDNTQSGKIESSNLNSGYKDYAKQFTAISGGAYFEFDLTYVSMYAATRPSNADAGSLGVFLGQTTDKASPAFQETGNAIGLQGRDNKKKVGFRNGDNYDEFQAQEGEKYRVLIYTDVAQHIYKATVYDSKGNLIYKTADKALSYRKNVDTINSICVSTNDHGTGDDGDIVVENFRVAEIEYPTAPTPSLGWDSDSKQFTLNFTKATDKPGDAILVDDKSTAWGENDTAVIKVGNMTNTAVTAYAAVADGVVKSAPATKSVYELVVDDIYDNAISYNGRDVTIGADRIAAANKVISHGGFYYTEAGNDKADTVTAKIIEVNVTTDTLTAKIKDSYKGFGLGFVLDENNKIYFGSSNKETEAHANGQTATGTTYDELTITLTDGNVTSASAVILSAADGTVITLDAVNIEFIETLIEEAEANGADVEADFIPEL